MSENWQVGDLALCVKTSQWAALNNSGKALPSIGPKAGEILTVRELDVIWDGSVGLKFSDFPDQPVVNWRGYKSDRFRKVTPPKADEFDREVIELMTGGKVPSHA